MATLPRLLVGGQAPVSVLSAAVTPVQSAELRVHRAGSPLLIHMSLFKHAANYSELYGTHYSVLSYLSTSCVSLSSLKLGHI